MNMTLKELRKQKKLTQVECAAYLGIPVRTYQNYENEAYKQGTLKYQYMFQKLDQYGYVDEENGILSLRRIQDVCTDVLSEYEVEYCYLFGSYAKGKATEISDVDLLIATSVSGMRFYEITEALREGLRKKVDVLNLKQLCGNMELLNEILKDGVKIYG